MEVFRSCERQSWGRDCRILKSHFYASAGIARYLLVEQETCAVHLHELVGDRHAQRSVTRIGEVLRLTGPPAATIAPADLLPPA
jgi:hypothetical protein